MHDKTDEQDASKAGPTGTSIERPPRPVNGAGLPLSSRIDYRAAGAGSGGGGSLIVPQNRPSSVTVFLNAPNSTGLTT